MGDSSREAQKTLTIKYLKKASELLCQLMFVVLGLTETPTVSLGHPFPPRGDPAERGDCSGVALSL